MKNTLIASLTLGAVLLLAGGLPVLAQTVNLDSGSYTLNNKDNVTPLLTGDLVQFGYYSNATTTNPFAGTFVPLTSAGAGSATTVIGEDTGNGAGAGTFAYFGLNLNLAPSAVPANGQIMTFVIYNNSSIAASTYYAAEADMLNTWNYSASAQFPIPQSFSLDDAGTWKSGDVGYTGISLAAAPSSTPEPQTGVLSAFGVLVLAWWQRRVWMRNASRS